ncbi:MAG: MATE family efflux transporter [Chloroflexota bacterium]
MAKSDSSTGRQPAARRDWTKGNILNNLVSLAWPIMIGSVLNTLGPVVDMIWVGKLGAASVAGVGVAAMLVQLLDALKMGLDMGTRAMIARLVGAGDNRGANNVALQGYVVTIGFAAIMGTLGVIFAGPIMTTMGLSPEVVARGAPYLRIQFVGILIMGLVRQNDGTMYASGDTLTPMRVAIVYRLFHIILDPFLIFGWWIFPRLETSGAAYANLISQGLGAGIGLWILINGYTRLRLNFKGFRPDANIIWRIVKIGVPASFTGMERNFGQLAMVWFVVPFGTVAVAAHSVIQRVEQFMQMPGQGLGQATGIMAAQNLGANQPERAEKSGWLGATLYSGIMIVAAIVLWFWAENIVRIFNSEPGLVKVAAAFIRIQIVGYLVFGYAVVLQQCLTSTGNTMAPALVVLLSIFGVQLPLAFFLTRFTSLGVYGTRWAIVISTIVTAVAYAIYFRMGKWKRKRL